MSKNTKDVVEDKDYSLERVPVTARKGFWPMFFIMLGFTFFSASMSVGAKLGIGLNLQGFIWAVLIGSIVLGAYTGVLGYIGSHTGMSLDLLAQHSFGKKGSYLPSALISFTQIGWFGVGAAMFAIPAAEVLHVSPVVLVVIAGACMTLSAYRGIEGLQIVSYISVPLIAVLGIYSMCLAISQGGGLAAVFAKSQGTLTIAGGAGLVIGSFVSGGTATPNFTRFAKNGKQGTIATVVAFFIGNSLMFFFGAISYIFVGGNDIFEVMIRLNLFYLAILVLGLNIWTTNDNALYTAGLGLANIFNKRKKPMVLISGVIGTLLSVWLYYNFCGCLNILNCTLPPVGIILVLSYFMNKKAYDTDTVKMVTVNWFAVAGVILGAIVANVVTWGIASINGMAVAAVCYVIGELVHKNK